MTVRALPRQLRANFHNLYLDIFWFGVLSGSTIAFLTIYAARLGASTLEISLLSAGPAVVNLVFSLPAGRWLENKALVPATFWSAALQRLGYLTLIVLPWSLGDRLQIWVIVLITLLMSIPGTLLAISFNALFAEAVPPEWRAEVVGKRNALMAVSLTATTLLSGQLLDRVIYPWNYAIVFTIGALGAGLSTYYVGRLRLSAGQAQLQLEDAQTPSTPMVELPESRVRPGAGLASAARAIPELRFFERLDLNKLLHLDLLRTSFGPFMLSYLLFYTFQYLGIPIFPLVQVRSLNLSDGIISLGSSLFYGVMLLVSLRIVDISARLGHKRMLSFGASIFGFYPLLLGLARGPALFWVASVVGGGAWAITNAGLTNRLMERVPANRLAAGMTLHNLVLNLGILLGSLAAPLLGYWAGLQPALFIVAGLRFLAGGIFWIWG